MGRAIRLTLEQLQVNAAERGGKFLSTFVPKFTEKAEWQCSKGHKWLATPRQIRYDKTWCPVCIGRAYTEEHRIILLHELKKIAEENGGRCLSDKWVSAKTKMEWQCSEGHTWKATPDQIKNTKTWCPKCANRGLTLDAEYKEDKLRELQQVASGRGGKLLSSEYTGANAQLEWECAFGHTWRASPSSVNGKSQSWCRQCNQTYSEKLVRIAFEAIFRKGFPNSRPYFLKSEKGRNLELDGYCEELSLAFEFDGSQHFKKTRFQGSEKALEDIRLRDIEKNELCANQGVTLIRINYKDDFRDVPKLIQSRIPVAREDLLDFDFNIEPNYRPAYEIENPIMELQELANSRGGKLISNVYVNIDTKLEWECSEGHRWFAKPDHVKNTGTWCKKCAMTKAWEKRRTTTK